MTDRPTRESILSEPAGRKLDALVHILVLGKVAEWIAREPDEFTEDASSPLGFTCNFGGAEFTADREWLVDDWFDPDERRRVPAYSADIAAAWEVVEKLRADDWLVSVKVMPAASSFLIGGDPSEYGGGGSPMEAGRGKVACEVMDMLHDGLKPRHDEFTLAETAPRSICLAALLATPGAAR